MVRRGLLHRDCDRQLDQLHLGGCGWSVGRTLAVQHRHDGAQWRRFDGRVLLRAFYFPKVWEMKANFEFEETWDIHATPLNKQKLDEIKKQKPDETKKIKDKNKERAKNLGRS